MEEGGAGKGDRWLHGCRRLYTVHCSLPLFFPSSIYWHNSTSLFDDVSALELYLPAEQAAYQNATAFPFLNNAEFNNILF